MIHFVNLNFDLSKSNPLPNFNHFQQPSREYHGQIVDKMKTSDLKIVGAAVFRGNMYTESQAHGHRDRHDQFHDTMYM